MAEPIGPPHPFLDWPGPLPFAHRGGAGDQPENTLPAFQAAVDLGYRYLETDAHVTRDGVVVAFHDDHLDRVAGRPGVIGDLTWAELAEVRVSGQPIPRLEELLVAFPEARVNIDAKHDEVVAPLADLLGRLGALDRVCIGSFSGTRLATLRRLLGSGLCTSAGPAATALVRLRSLGLPVRAGRGADCLQVPVRFKGVVPVVDRAFVQRAHRLGWPVHVWTVDEPAEMHALLDLGVDGLMTDRPTVLKEVLVARGQWVAP